MSEKNEWKLVPVIATDEMEAAAEDDYEQTGATFPRWKSAYAAMLAAAPAPPAAPTLSSLRGFAPEACDGMRSEDYVNKVRNGDWSSPDCTPPASAQDDAKDERQEFEAWAEDQGFVLDCDFFEVSGQYYDRDDTQLAYDIWRAARASVAAPAAGDALDAKRYRWLRDQTETDGIAIVMKNKHFDGSRTCAENIDEFIDAALADQVPQQGEA